MVDLGQQEDWSDYMLIEWAAALELHQRGRVKAVLPLLVGETDFWSEAHAAFGGIQALPAQTSDRGSQRARELTPSFALFPLRNASTWQAGR